MLDFWRSVGCLTIILITAVIGILIGLIADRPCRSANRIINIVLYAVSTIFLVTAGVLFFWKMIIPYFIS